MATPPRTSATPPPRRASRNPAPVQSPTPPRRQSSERATSFLLIALVGVFGFFGYKFWRDNEARRVAAEAEAAARAEQPVEAPAGPDPISLLKDIEYVPPPIPVYPAPLNPIEPEANQTTGKSGAETTPVKAVALAELKEGRAVLAALADSNYRYTSAVENTFLAFQKAKTRAQLKDLGTELPTDFLSWSENDAEIALALYGTRARPLDTLLWLRSLEIDLGRDVVRGKYKQLCLATATVAAADGAKADLTPRPLYKLTIGGDPRKPVNTKDKTRALDMNDHIINFLEDHPPVTGDIVGGMAEALPELVYGSDGRAVSLGKKKGVSTQVKRELIAADVMASSALQREFNAYMASKGFTIEINCGDRIIHSGQTDSVPKEKVPNIEAAYNLFRKAYEEKGRLALADPNATYAERLAYIIRNDKKSAFPDYYGPKKTKLPEFPLDAPWPMLTFLVADDQPLREREDTYLRLKKKGEFHTYGEYIGNIAQQGTMQRARRLAPFHFGYRSGPSRVGRDPMAMMIKDGGVCGTMAAMQVCSYNVINVPSTTAGQPGHCALIYAARDKHRKYTYEGGQYVTAGHEDTHPHCPWFLGDINDKKPMSWHLATTHALNFDPKAFMQSFVPLQVAAALPDDLRASHEKTLLASALPLNPYNIALVKRAFSSTKSVTEHLALWKSFADKLPQSYSKVGLDKTGGLYFITVQGIMADTLAYLPMPTDEELLRTFRAILNKRAAYLAEIAAKAKKNS